MRDMDTVSDIIQKFNGASVLARQLDLPATTVASWKHRSSIPVEHWTSLVELAERSEILGLTYEKLVQIHSSRAPVSAVQDSAA